VGELDLIRRIREKVGGPGRGTIIGLGDDAAAFEPAAAVELLTCDAFVEGVHFRRDLASLREIGAKCMVANVSDIAAMGGFPTRAAVSLCVPPGTAGAAIEELYDGLTDVAGRYGLEIVGGDVVSSREGLVISIALIGAAERERVVTRSGAVVGDVVVATGAFGGSEAGLAALLQKIPVDDAVEAATRRHLSPTPRLAEAQAILDVATPHAMIDVSDGLSSEVWHLSEESGVGITLHEERIPIAPSAIALAGRLGRDPLELALGSGEEFELLVTIPASEVVGTIDHVRAVTGTGVTSIGEVVDASNGCRLVGRGGGVVPLERTGYEHLSDDEG